MLLPKNDAKSTGIDTSEDNDLLSTSAVEKRHTCDADIVHR